MTNKIKLSDDEIKKVSGGDFEISQPCGCGTKFRYSVANEYFYCPKCGNIWIPADS